MKSIVRKLLRTSLIVTMVFGVMSQGVPVINMSAEEIQIAALSGYQAEVSAFAVQRYEKSIRELFRDNTLAKMVQVELNKTTINEKITIDDLDKITDLNDEVVPGQKIYDFTGIWYLRNLKELVLNGQTGITDFMPLLTLGNLKALTLQAMNLTDLSMISELRSLESLDLFGNGISDISPLNKLKNLVNLDLGNNEVNDMTPLSDLPKLRFVTAINNKVTDVKWVLPMPVIQVIHLYMNQVTDISILKEKEFANGADITVVTEINKKVYYDRDGFTLRHRVKGFNGNPPAVDNTVPGVEYEAPYITWNAEALRDPHGARAHWAEHLYDSAKKVSLNFVGEYILEVGGL